MSLAARLANEFTSTIRGRGHNYFLRRRVHIRSGSDRELTAEVRGSYENYDVGLHWADGTLLAWCDCPYFESNGFCKHIWATILAADAQGYLSSAASAKNLELDFADDPDSSEEGEYDALNLDDDEEEEDSFSQSAGRWTLPTLAPRPPAWQTQLAEIVALPVEDTGTWPAKRQIHYVVDVPASNTRACLALSLAEADYKDGAVTRSGALKLKRAQIQHLPLVEDREILTTLTGGANQYYGWTYGGYDPVADSYSLTSALAGMIFERIVRTGRCVLQLGQKPSERLPLAWDEGGAWAFALEVRRRGHEGWTVAGVLWRAGERMNLTDASLIAPGGFVFAQDRVAPLAADAPFQWISYLRRTGAIEVPEEDKDAMLSALLASAALPVLDLPEELRYEEVPFQPRPHLHIHAAERTPHKAGRLNAELSFDYNGRLVPESAPARGFYDAAERRLLRRDSDAEKAASAMLGELGAKFQRSFPDPNPSWKIAPTKLPRVVGALVVAGWHIEADGKVFRRPGAFHMEVSSGVDWFELHGSVDYGESRAKLPALLAALRKGENMVRLDDGTYGVMPEEWLRRFGMLAGLGTPEDGHIRFRRSQAGLLDALLASEPEATCDETFSRMREQLRLFQGVEAATQPDGFVGHLRDYQREGLGWMDFLRRFSFGGCLADDMGVGKTAQVLALLETRRGMRAAGEPLGPSLVVVPKSLVFNWKQEAERFAPQLRVLDYTGLDRKGDDFAEYDLILTTYGTLRRDALRMKDVKFDYVVLDEAQAIKNAATESAKAARLLHASHRLALSGTPVENHLGELWSLFEFLNPGMLGAASVFKLAGGSARDPGEETRTMLAQALRPFILRRTKQQVARELPAKTEQTLYCEMDAVQRKLYNELRQHYRQSLLSRVETEGLAKSKIQVLEALLRLRQAACHPGLLDAKRLGEGSAKLDVLLDQLREVIDEGHKALVFSQFTSLLSIVRNRLEGAGIVYEYLDGSTRDRQARVERFQNDAACPLFLISLKAGGLGLNLTAAEYVFLLDPWWNPAVEAQAVDRAHRIGQTRQVFAYRLIARDTVEEKVLELQKTKRDLAAAIIGENNSVIGNLRREDLELLLS
jgi:superfamily II DNA or RNA helicase